LKIGQVLIAVLITTVAYAQDLTLQGQANIVGQHGGGNSNVVVWLTPISHRVPVVPTPSLRLVQRNKQFFPHVLAVTEGSTIEFPNQDPFFHDVFSIYHGKPFDLGLYESGAVRRVVFSRPGVSYIFCNIHPEMSAVVVVTQTPFFVITGEDGKFAIAHVPPGRYRFDVWYEFASEAELATLARQIDISPEQTSLETITIHAMSGIKEHLNKYGEAYTQDRANY